VRFFRDVLGLEPWSRQIEVIEAVRDHERVAVRSGHKVGKSTLAAGVALWFYCSFPNARVIMSSTTARQVEQILWRELRMQYARSGKCIACKAQDALTGHPMTRPCPHSRIIDGEIHELARSGLKAADFREVVGFTAREAEAVAGISGPAILYIVDEASGVPDIIFEAIEGNRAGGAKILLLGNPTQNEGEFYEAFHEKSRFYTTLTISSEETPNVTEGRKVVPGLADRPWIEEKKLEWGEKSPMYLVRVKGIHVPQEEGKIISLHAIAEAEMRWPDADAGGRLFIGLDPAGESGDGDETVFATRRGMRVLGVVAMRGLTPEAHLAHLLGMIREHRHPNELPAVVVVDREGMIGARVYGTLKGHQDMNAQAFELVGVRSSELADGGNPRRVHDRVRDKLWANLEQWMREGGAIPEDARLAKELNAPKWIFNDRNRAKVTPKDELRKQLGRSPDRAEAVTLATWEPITYRDAPGDQEDENDGDEDWSNDGGASGGGINPYKGVGWG